MRRERGTTRGRDDGAAVSGLTAGLAVLVYVVVAMVGRGATSGEVFPFFSWDLFSTVPQDTVRAAIYIDRLDGAVLDPPVELAASGRARGASITASSLARDLWSALRTDPDAVDRVAASLVANHLPEDAAWSLRVERFDPVERFTRGDVDALTVARFDGVDRLAPAIELSAASIRTAGRSWTRVETPVGRLEGVRTGDGTLRVTGWAALSDGRLPTDVVIVADGRAVARTSVGVPRHDVRRHLGRPEALAAGFEVTVEAAGAAAVEVVALFEDGTARTVEARP